VAKFGFLVRENFLGLLLHLFPKNLLPFRQGLQLHGLPLWGIASRIEGHNQNFVGSGEIANSPG
jgi:hypothetical protein